jgi:hypothetical protein
MIGASYPVHKNAPRVSMPMSNRLPEWMALLFYGAIFSAASRWCFETRVITDVILFFNVAVCVYLTELDI